MPSRVTREVPWTRMELVSQKEPVRIETREGVGVTGKKRYIVHEKGAMTAEEVALVCGVSPSTVNSRIKRESFHPKRMFANTSEARKRTGTTGEDKPPTIYTDLDLRERTAKEELNWAMRRWPVPGGVNEHREIPGR